MLRTQSFPLLVCSDLDTELGVDFGKCVSTDVRGPDSLLTYQSE